MIKLKPLLEEKEGHRKIVSSEEMKKLSAGNFSIASNRYLVKHDPQPLIRMASPKYDMYQRISQFELVDPRKSERKSRDTSNFYTVMMGGLPSWKGWPRRSFCIIFFVGLPTGKDAKDTEHYGSQSYRILPSNGAKIAVSTSSDLFDKESMPNLESVFVGKGTTGMTTSVDSIGVYLSRLMEICIIAKEGFDESYYHRNEKIEKYIHDPKFNNYSEIIKEFDEIMSVERIEAAIKLLIDFSNDLANKLNYYHPYLGWFGVMLDQLRKYGNWESLLDDAFDPEKNGLKLMTVENVENTTSYSAVEAWTESPCLMVHEGELEDVES